jgi:hypothetical protein
MVFAQSCVLGRKVAFFFALKHRQNVIFHDLSGQFVRNCSFSSLIVILLLLQEFGFNRLASQIQAADTFLALSVVIVPE